MSMTSIDTAERMAIFECTPEFLQKILHLPDGAVIDAVTADPQRNGVLVCRVRGAGWKTATGQHIVKATPMVYQRTVETRDGERVTFISHINWGFPNL